jgi:GntR family transcriptional regulator, rspAB operon transcriptional repressor
MDAQPLSEGGRVRRITTAVAIYRQLHEAIVGMELLPGAALQDKVLCARFAVSRTPVREALIRLAEDGLVDIFPQSGTFVSRIKGDAVPEALVIRQALEGVTVSLLAKACGDAALGQLDSVIGQQIFVAGQGDTAAFHQADELFHETIAGLSGHPGIWRLLKQVKAQIDRTRRLTLPVPGRMLQVVQEHRVIRDAIAARDPAAAQAAMAHHLNVVLPDLEHLRSEYPDYFA